MKTNNYKLAFKCILLTFFMFFTTGKVFASDEKPIWYESKEEAFSIAKEQKKHVLLIMGEKSCSYCLIAKNHINKPGLKEVAKDNFILWYCDTNKSREGDVYDSMYASASMPLVCIIDPNDPESRQSHINGKISTDDMRNFLNKNLPTGNEKVPESTD